MCQLLLIKHGKGAVGFRCFGLGPHFRPVKGIHKLQQLFDANASWASRRGMKDLKKMISKSTVVVTAWNENKLIGFGRATSDTIFRAVLWDIVVDNNYRNLGIGRKIIQLIINDNLLKNVEKIYLMTTHCNKFYLKMNFDIEKRKTLMVINR
tara:strand:- start:91 stop:546 length:456 start_codon:yes stop_codon:yes gene_type:complete